MAGGLLKEKVFSRTNVGEEEERYRKSSIKLLSDGKESLRNNVMAARMGRHSWAVSRDAVWRNWKQRKGNTVVEDPQGRAGEG